MPDVLAHVFLAMGDLAFISVLLLIGFIRTDRPFFYELSCLLLFSITINVALKGTFQIPLAKELGTHSFAFPSGHMQIATTFYACLILYGNTQFLKHPEQKKTLWILNITLILLLIGFGWGLIHCGYHTLYDVIGAVLTALLLIKFYRVLQKNLAKYASWILLILATLTTMYSWIRYPEVPRHAWVAWYGLIGLVASETIYKLLSKAKS